MTGTSYATSAEMASQVGAFPGYKKNAKHMQRVIRNHQRAAHGKAGGYEELSVKPVPLDHKNCPDSDLVKLSMKCWDDARKLGKKFGS